MILCCGRRGTSRGRGYVDLTRRLEHAGEHALGAIHDEKDSPPSARSPSQAAAETARLLVVPVARGTTSREWEVGRGARRCCCTGRGLDEDPPDSDGSLQEDEDFARGIQDVKQELLPLVTEVATRRQCQEEETQIVPGGLHQRRTGILDNFLARTGLGCERRTTCPLGCSPRTSSSHQGHSGGTRRDEESSAASFGSCVIE